MQVIPVVAPNINWEEFVAVVNVTLGRSPTDSLDAAGIAPGTLKTFIAALGEFEHQGTTPVPYLRSRSCDKALEHISFSFIIIDADICGILRLNKLSLLSATPGVTLMSGTLRQWRETLIEGSRARNDHHTRLILNEVSRHFLRFGLSDLFAEYEIVDLRDGTFALENKKPC